jgi:hypothetical protein
MSMRDVEVKANWYEKVGFDREVYEPRGRVAMRFGQQKFDLRLMSQTANGEGTEWRSILKV